MVTTAYQDIEKWILTTLSTKSPVFNGLPPCPYAKSAWLDNKVFVHHLNDKFPLHTWITAELENYTYHWPKSKEVVVLAFDPDKITASELSGILDAAKPMLDKRGYTALEDHPYDVEQVGDVVLNQGSWALILLQETAKLTEARTWLESKDYYKNWDPDYKKSVQQR